MNVVASPLPAAAVASRPAAVLVGGPDVDARIDLMRRLRGDVAVSALGSDPALRSVFGASGFEYAAYRLDRQANPASDLLTLGELHRIFRRLRPQIVHTFDTKPGVWGCLAARWAGVPVVIRTITGLGSLYAADGLRTRWLRAAATPFQRMAGHAADLTVFQNQDDARLFIAARLVPAGKTTVIAGSGVATDVFDPSRVTDLERAKVRAELGIQSGETVVTMIGRVIRDKGVLEFMAAARAVRARRPRVRFVLVGSEDSESRGRLSAEEIDRLKATVTWPGRRRDIPAVLAVSDVFVLPSYREGVPRVALEAASMGLPVITTDTPGCRDVVEDGVNGYLVPPGDAAALARAIIRLVQAPEFCRRFGQRSRRLAKERFDLSVIADQTRSLYRELLERKGRAGA